MKILTASQQQELDKKTMEKEPISSLDLMERAANIWMHEFERYLSAFKKIDKTHNFGVFCGPGNNGGDGLVVARLLDKMGYKVNCFFVALSDSGSEDFEQNRIRLQGTNVNWIKIDDNTEVDIVEYKLTLIVDAIFGTGLTRPAEGLAKRTIQMINDLHLPVFSVDVPSGLFCNEPNEIGDAVINAAFTFTFHSPKLSFFLPGQSEYVGRFDVLDIGLDSKTSQELESQNFNLTLKELNDIKRSRGRFTHKGTYGHAGIVAGSYSKMGAALLSVEAALRSGTGLTTAYIPESGNTALNTRVPSVMLSNTGKKRCETIVTKKEITYGIGPGLGISEETIAAVQTFLMNHSDPIVIDADALNIISDKKDLLELVPQNSILTPHPKEFERLCGSFKNSYERLEMQRSFSKEKEVYMVLKDAFTSISTPEGKVYFSTFGSSGMATAGSGDVLTGIITGLLAQDYSPEDAALLGVGLHGLAGEACALAMGEEAMISEDLLKFISKAYKKI